MNSVFKSIIRAFCVLGIFIVTAQTEIKAQSLPQGSLGWAVPNESPAYGSPTDACYNQWQSLYSGAPKSAFLGVHPTNNPNIYGCDWTNFPNGRCAGGIGSCGTFGLAPVWLTCSAGYTAAGGQCVLNAEVAPPLPSSCSGSGGNAGPGIGSAPTPPISTPNVGNPIAVFDGAKLEEETDFETVGDKGRLFIRRFIVAVRRLLNWRVMARSEERLAVGGSIFRPSCILVSPPTIFFKMRLLCICRTG